MMVLYLFIGALALLLAVLFLGFVGCGLDVVGSAGPDYPKTIKATPDIVAYWRLGEPDTTPVPSLKTAKDQLGGLPGDYRSIIAVTTPDPQTHAPATSGIIALGVTPGLLQLSPLSPGIDTDGGFVLVPFDIRLNPHQFTFEAWVSPDPNMATGFFHCLVESVGPGGLDTPKTGWALYLGPDDPNKTPPEDYFWQVWMGNGTEFKRVAIAKGTGGAPPTKLRLTYLVLTFDGKELNLWLYYPDTKQELDVPHLQGARNPDVKVDLGGPFKRNDTSTAGQGPFVIGMGRKLFAGGATPTQRLYPFKGRIQEVAFYKRDLAGPWPHYNGLTSTLGPHEATGGNF